MPKAGLIFALRGSVLFEREFEDATEISETHRRLAYWLESYYDGNEAIIQRLFNWFRWATFCVLAQVVLWIVEIVTAPASAESWDSGDEDRGKQREALVHLATILTVESVTKIGVLAVQGNFREHATMLRRLGAEPVEVRKPEQLDGLDGLVIPGGESTTITRLMRLYGIEEAIRRFERPILGTCAGMIVLDRDHLGVLDIDIRRNAYGRQVASFEADLELAGGGKPLRGVFIRAPRVERVGGEVAVLAELDGEPVLLRQGRCLAATFHPELTDDTRVHELFLDSVHKAKSEQTALA